MTTSQNYAFLETWIDRVWVREDETAISEFFAQGPATGLAQQSVSGPEEFLEFHRAILQMVEEVRIDIDHFVEQGEWFSYMGVFRAKCRSTGKVVSMEGGAMCRVVDGVMVEAHNAWDFLSFFIDLGLAPKDAFANGLAGRQIVH